MLSAPFSKWLPCLLTTLAEELYPEVKQVGRLRPSLVRSCLSGLEMHSPAVPRLAARLLQPSSDPIADMLCGLRPTVQPPWPCFPIYTLEKTGTSGKGLLCRSGEALGHPAWHREGAWDVLHISGPLSRVLHGVLSSVHLWNGPHVVPAWHPKPPCLALTTLSFRTRALMTHRTTPFLVCPHTSNSACTKPKEISSRRDTASS